MDKISMNLPLNKSIVFEDVHQVFFKFCIRIFPFFARPSENRLFFCIDRYVNWQLTVSKLCCHYVAVIDPPLEYVTWLLGGVLFTDRPMSMSRDGGISMLSHIFDKLLT